MNYHRAVKQWNTLGGQQKKRVGLDEVWATPRRGTHAQAEVRSIQEGGPDTLPRRGPLEDRVSGLIGGFKERMLRRLAPAPAPAPRLRMRRPKVPPRVVQEEGSEADLAEERFQQRKAQLEKRLGTGQTMSRWFAQQVMGVEDQARSAL